MLDWQVALGFLYTTLSALTPLTNVIGSGANARAYEAGKVPEAAQFPYLTVQRTSFAIAHPVGGSVQATAQLFDVVLWALGTSDASISAAFAAIDGALADTDPVMYSGYQVSSAVVGEIPPAPPPQQPGDPETVRLGRTYEIFVGAT
jgi:hypothetical protein